MSTPTTERERVILSGLFALLNCGHTAPDDLESIVAYLHRAKTLTVDGAAYQFCAHYAENDEMMEMYSQEAQHWYKSTFSKKKYSREEITRIWPQHAHRVFAKELSHDT